MTGKLLVVWLMHKRFLECTPVYANELGTINRSIQ